VLDLEASDPTTVGPYALRARLGEGGMGRVYLAYPPSGRLLAVKLIRSELAGDATFRDRFRREVAAARLVSGAFTAPVVDADPDAPMPWLATQYVPGPSLHEAVAQAGPFAEPVLRRLAAGILEAIIAVHRVGIVHRDLKPSNVLLAADGPRLIDFGIARAADHTELTRSGDIVGTAAYMSPEQASGEEAGPAADVFATAAVLIFAATGRGPFGRGTPAAVLFRVVHGEPDLTGVPPSLHDTLRSCLAKDPTARPGPEALLGWFANGVQVAGPSWPSAVTRLLDARAAELPSPPTGPPPHPSTPSHPSTPPRPSTPSWPPTRVAPEPGVILTTRVPPPTRLAPPPTSPPPSPPPPSPPPATPPPTPTTPPTPDPSGPAGPRHPLPATPFSAPGRPVVFPGRWRFLLATGIAVLVATVVLVLIALSLFADAASNDSVSESEQSSSIVLGLVLITVALCLLPSGLWRLRYARRRPAVSIGMHGLHVEVGGGASIDIGWPYVARADVIRLGRRQVLAVWPATPGTTWVGARGRRRHRGRYRAGWHDPLHGCDVLLDIGLLHGHPAQEISSALGAVPRPRGPGPHAPGGYRRPPGG